MSSVYKDLGVANLFDNNKTTIAHTKGGSRKNERGNINMDLKTPNTVPEVLIMGRDKGYKDSLDRVNNTLINTTDERNVTKECGRVVVEEVKAGIIVRVVCKEMRRVINVRVIASSIESAVNIAELRICAICKYNVYMTKFTPYYY